MDSFNEKDLHRWIIIKYLLGLVTVIALAMIILLWSDKKVEELSALAFSVFGFASTVFTVNYFTSPSGEKGSVDGE